MPTVDFLWSELCRLVLHIQLSHDASRSAYPLDSHTSAAAWAALANQVRSWDSLSDPSTFRQWGYIQLQPNDDEDLIEWLTGNSTTIKRELQRLVRSKDIAAGKVVSLPALPIPFLRNAPLIEGRWIDATVLELAEFGAVLEDRGWTPRPTDDSHPLAFQEFVQADAEGESSPIDDASWLDARQAATDRVRSYRGKRRAFQGRDYVNLAPYGSGAQASSALALKLLSKTALSSTHGTISQRIASSISLAGPSASGRSNPWAIAICGLSTNFKRLASSRRPGQDYSPITDPSPSMRRMPRTKKSVTAGGTAPRMPSP